MKFLLFMKGAKMRIYDEKQNFTQKRRAERVASGGRVDAAGEPIAKFEYSIRHNVLRKMMQLRNGVDLKSKSQVKKLVYVNRSSIVLPIGTAAIRPTLPSSAPPCHI